MESRCLLYTSMGLAGGVLLVRSKKQSATRRTDNDFDLDEDDEDEHAQQE